MATETKQILEELRIIKSDLEYLKGHIVDLDLVITDEDRISIRKAEKDLKEGRTKRLI